MYKKTILIIVICILSSCVAKKTTIQKEYINKVDTLIVTKDRIITERFTDTLTIEKPCDSIGNLKPFKQVVSIPQGNIVISAINGNIDAKIDLKAYESIFESKYKTKYENKIKESSIEIIKYRTPLWMWLTIGFMGVVIFLLLRFR